MRRTQLYLEDETWKALKGLAKRSRVSMSDLVRAAIHEKYFADEESRKAVLLSAIGIWKDRTDLPDTEEYVRSLRQGRRLKRLWG